MTAHESLLELIAYDAAGRIVKRLPLGEDDVLHAGSGLNTHLRLEDQKIAPVAMRIVRNPDEVVVSNLEVTGAIRLGAQPLTTSQPYSWRPGEKLYIGAYRLELKATEADVLPAPELRTVAPVGTVAPAGVVVRPPMSAPVKAPPLPIQPAPFPVGDRGAGAVRQTAVLEPAVLTAPPPPRPTTLPGEPPRPRESTGQPAPAGGAVPPGRGWRGLDDQATQVYRGVPLAEPPPPAESSGYTRVKDFRSDVAALSGQIGLKQINFVPGERILVPLSLHNLGSHRLELNLALAGFPSTWSIINAPRPVLEPGQTQGYDLILQTATVERPAQLDGMLRAYDGLTPNIAVTLPLRMIPKREADLTGRFHRRPMTLHLYNHTLSRMKVWLSVRGEQDTAHLQLPATVIDLAAGQPVNLPLRLRLLRRPLLRATQSPFHIIAQQGIRAPLAIPAVVTVRPLLRWWMLLLVGLGGIGLLVAGLLWNLPPGGSLSSLFQAATATVTPSATPTASFTPNPTATPTPLPTATLPAFVDPRSAACQAQVPLPAGWAPYVVRPGDNQYRLGLRFGVSPEEIRRVNCLGLILIVNSTILLPVPGTP